MPSKPKYDALHARQVRERYIRQQRELNSYRSMQLLPVTVVDAFSGDADGLLPITALKGNLAIKVEDWRQTNPPPGALEELHFEWRPDGSSEYIGLLSESFTTPITETFPLDRFIEQRHFLRSEGLFHFRYGVKGWNSANIEYSLDQPITVDRTPPYGPDDPPAIDDPGSVNDAVLDADNGVFVTVPDFVEDKKAFVTIAIVWSDKVPPPDQPIVPDVSQLLPADRRVLVARNLVERYPSGDHYVAYELFDKAGNRSRPSRVRTVAVARGPLPANLKPPVVPLASDGLIDLADARLGVTVEIPGFDQYIPDDDVVVKWGATKLTPKRIGEGDNPFPVKVVVSWEHLKREYTAPVSAPYDMTVPVTYEVLRGTTPFPLPSADGIEVDVNLAYPGPVNPDEPDPVNISLNPVVVTGDSATPDHLIDADQGKDATATIKLYSPTRADEVITVYWNGVALAATVTLDGTESLGDEVSVTVRWSEIEAGGPGDVPVYYTITHVEFINPQRSHETWVKVDAVPIILAAATFPDISSVGSISLLNCDSLRKRTSDGEVGYRVSVPASRYLIGGEKITVSWVLKEADQTTDVPGTELSQELTIGADADVNGIEWFVQPYSKYILPAQLETTNGWAYAHLIYTLSINSNIVTSQFVDTVVGIQDLGDPSGTCNITSLPEFP
ncbi:hypothetical protein V2K50_02325 [Pseudomonas alliivorans]|nr:hypothetical protein [Pseudomonas alliivorans]